MKKLLTTMLLAMAATAIISAIQPPEGSFSWGVQVPLQIDYLSTETLSVTSATIPQFTVTYQLVDSSMARYVAVNGDVVTVLNNYTGGNEQTHNRIFIKAVISGMTEYEDTELVTYIETRKIYPTLQWNCTLVDMPCGSSVPLSVIHGNTDNPDIDISFTASDNVSTPSRCVSIDQTKNIMTATNVGTGIYVTANIDSSVNYKATSMAYLRNDSIVRFNVVRGHRTITWNASDFQNIDNFSGDIQLHVDYQDSGDEVTILSDNPLIAEVLPGNILRIHKAGTVRLSATVAGTENYFDATSDTTVNIPAQLPTVVWDEDVIRDMEQHKVITSTTCGYAMKVWVRSNYGDMAQYLFSIPADEQDIATVIGDTALCCYSEGIIHLSVVAKAAGLTSQSITHVINVRTGMLEFVNEGNWNDVNCWSRSDLAKDIENYEVNIVNHCVISNGVDARCKALNIYANGSLTIEPQARLTVEGKLENFGSETSLYLKADKDGSAEVIMPAGNPRATVEMYIDHSINGSDTVWCSRGISLDNGTLRSNTGKLRVKSWNDRWEKRSGSKIQLAAFEGYLIADTLPKTYTVDGKLLTGDKTFSLHLSEGSHYYLGRNFLTNSYTAPVNISAIDFGDMSSELFYYVNGQYRTLPKFTAYCMGYGKWLSGQSLFAKANSNNSRLAIDYQKCVMTESDESLFNMLRISATSQSGKTDTLVLMDAPFCSEQYDDGYDGTKWEGDTCMPQLYATTSWGKAYVNVEQSIVAQRIGFKAAREGETYTLRFHTEGLDSTYSQLYLFDAKTQEFTDIIGGETYSFIGTSIYEDNRFTIMRDRVVPEKDKYGRCIMVLGDKVLLVGFESSDMPVRVITMDGKVVCEYNTKDGPWLQLPTLAPGFYFINAERCTTKFYK